MATRISKNFTLEELCASETAKAKRIDNTPVNAITVNLVYLAQNVLQPLRDAMGEAIKIGSGYRSPALNKAVGGVGNSQHMLGEACDIFIDGNIEKGKKWFAWIKANCVFDQLIWEHNAKGTYWIHVSHKAFEANRKQVIDNLLKK